MENLIIAAALDSKEAYEVIKNGEEGRSFSPLSSLVYGAIGEYYDADPNVGSVNRELIQSRLLGRISNDKHAAPLKQYFRDLPANVSAVNVTKELRELRRRAIGSRLSIALANGSPEEEVNKLLQAYAAADAGNDTGRDSADSLVDVLDTSDLTQEVTENDSFIKLWPRSLNDRLDGGALRGHHIVIFARPEVGKTLFAVNLCAGFLHQGLSVLYVGNEEPVADIRDRIRGRLLKQGKQWVRANRGEAADRLQKASLGTVEILGSASFSEARRYLARTGREPVDVVILDQIRNMRLKSDSRTAELEAAGIEARAIAKEFNALVVSVTQAGDSATNKVYLEMSDVDSSKTGLPASADLMVGIGGDTAMRQNGLVGLSLPKNKLSGLHDRWTAQVDYQTGVIT